MDKIYYFHIRNQEWANPADINNHETVNLPKGGATYAAVVLDDRIVYHRAICNPSDMFNRRKGRLMAAGRLKKGLSDPLHFVNRKRNPHYCYQGTDIKEFAEKLYHDMLPF